MKEDTKELTPSPKPSGEERKLSAAKLEANRKNAQRSTGPRTEEGKARSRFNAMTHGLTSRLAFQSDDQSSGQLEALREAFRNRLPADDPIAELKLDLFLVEYWRQAKAIEYEKKYLSYERAFVLEGAGLMHRYQTESRRHLLKMIEALEEYAPQSNEDAIEAKAESEHGDPACALPAEVDEDGVVTLSFEDDCDRQGEGTVELQNYETNPNYDGR